MMLPENVSPLRVLLVEDSADDGDLVLLELENQWPTLHSRRVENEGDLRQALAAGPWDVVISDYNLPRFSAQAALRLLRQEGHDSPFLVVSGFVGEEAAADMMKAGADDFVMKANLARLIPAVERALRDGERRRAHQRAEEKLRLSEKRLRAITGAVGEGILVVDTEGRLSWMNPAAERLLGWREAELIGQSLHQAIHRPSAEADCSDPACCGILQALRQGEAQRCEDDIFLRRDGEPLSVAFVATPMFEDGRLVGAVTTFQDTGRRKRMLQELLDARQRSRELSGHLHAVREAERTAIARELHDELGQMATALKIDVSWLRARLPPAETALHDKIAGMTRLIDDTVDWVRRMAAELRPVMLDDLGLQAAIEWLLENFGQRQGIVCQLQVVGDPFPLDRDIGTAAFRIVQECLTNVARHARASRVAVELRCPDEMIEIAVSDDGCGFDPDRPGASKRFGLLGIRERAEMLGGTHQISSRPGGGTRVTVRLPRVSPCTSQEETRP